LLEEATCISLKVNTKEAVELLMVAVDELSESVFLNKAIEGSSVSNHLSEGTFIEDSGATSHMHICTVGVWRTFKIARLKSWVVTARL
jgi:hypothetical protein